MSDCCTVHRTWLSGLKFFVHPPTHTSFNPGEQVINGMEQLQGSKTEDTVEEDQKKDWEPDSSEDNGGGLIAQQNGGAC